MALPLDQYRHQPGARRCLWLAILLIPMLVLTACGGNSGAAWGPGSTQGNTSTLPITQQGGLIILAAPALQSVLPPMAEAFFQAHKLHVPYAFDFSNAKQIAMTTNTAADVDLLITDDRDVMVNARFLGFTRSVGSVIATDSLSVILPQSNPGKIRTLQDLARPGLRYLGVSPMDGLNRHIRIALESMLLAPAFGPEYAARVFGNLISNYTDGLVAAEALALPHPAGDFSIVYHTNYLEVTKQRGAQTLQQLSIPAQFNPPVQMLAAIASQAHNPSLSQQFIDFMRSPAGQAIWARYGFQAAR